MTKEDIYKPLEEALTKYLTKPEHLEFIRSAFDFAYEKHDGQVRKSGRPYIVHPVDVAITLCEYQVDPNTLAAGLLHDVIEDTNTSYEDINERFGEEVADIVEGVTKLDLLHYERSKAATQARNHQKMILAMSKDIRVIFVKLADRLNNMRTLNFLDDERQTRISRETLDIFAPIAHRLGMYRLKAELEDLSFKYLYPAEYQDIAKLLNDKKGNREQDVLNMTQDIVDLLTKENFDFEVKGRIKNIHSVYYKMKNKNIDFEEINDLLALRIIVNTISDCYRAIGIVHSRFVPVPGRFKDYIAMPKPNMYQSLHTTVVNRGKIFEIQIRTKEMDEIAEKGVAAHWAYKENKPGTSSRKSIEDIVSSKLRWYSELIKYTEESDSDEEILDIFTDDILNANVYVFTPKGDIIDLSQGATPLDFAFRIHTKVGEKTVGAIVNGKIRPLDYTLKTGDLVEIKTSQSSVGPNENWLKIAKTSNARSKIKNFLNKQRREFLIEKGKEDLDREIENRHLVIQLTDKVVKEKFMNRGIKSVEDLYYEVGKNVVSAIGACNLLVDKEEMTDEELIEKINKPEPSKRRYVHSDINIIVEGLDKPSVRLANCCNPVLGDDIVGYVSRNSGIVVHRHNCKNVETFEKERLIDVFWGVDMNVKYSSNLKILVLNRDNVLAEIVHAATNSKAKIDKVTAQTNNLREGIIKMKISIGSLLELDTVVANIQKVKGVYSIERIS
ncbi:MAG: bifunctional (p)ppGpp synthetase/guanosine-3',5'-bis(diphosphate) 3'-pyrophosphohydrolase [Bacilli bacterium]|nr:bifunctional (p)ppGpp synthetase/guanosine-3',5'-bis(diphosphate) 3'-pyrophosphohydrolase [Bacilli bacterium]MBN2876093.1 bifunctional (p)ppGpp synthetase/guanosine-3',5'-bis(diphosphate) 3'-pyrophosphohydrolase [Bacilli bacterium]